MIEVTDHNGLPLRVDDGVRYSTDEVTWDAYLWADGIGLQYEFCSPPERVKDNALLHDMIIEWVGRDYLWATDYGETPTVSDIEFGLAEEVGAEPEDVTATAVKLHRAWRWSRSLNEEDFNELIALGLEGV